jgi:hypothetical protein
VKYLRGRLTYANVMATLAVFLVLGGATAFAATKIGANELKANSVLTGKIKKEAVTTSKIKNEAVTGAKANESTFGTVPAATNATNATNAINANHALVADVGSPRAYARVLNNTGGLGVDEALSKGIADSSLTFVGGSVYCFELGFSPKSVQTTVDWFGGGANTFAQANIGRYIGCPEGSDASVRTTDNGGGGIGNINFYVSFFD